MVIIQIFICKIKIKYDDIVKFGFARVKSLDLLR